MDTDERNHGGTEDDERVSWQVFYHSFSWKSLPTSQSRRAS